MKVKIKGKYFDNIVIIFWYSRFIGFQGYTFISSMLHYILQTVMCSSLDSSLNVVSIVIKLMFKDVLNNTIISYARLMVIDSISTNCYGILKRSKDSIPEIKSGAVSFEV